MAAALGVVLLLASACGDGGDAGPAPEVTGAGGDTSPAPEVAGGGGDASPAPEVPVAAGPLADLTVAADRFEPATVSSTFTPDSCEVQEACVDAPGTRRLLAFSTLISNVGAAELVFGDPAGNPAYDFSPCHGHYHLHGFALYQLLDVAGAVVLTGHKQGFCVRDSEAVPGATADPKYTDCAYQGLSIGWGDLYAAGLPCQWIDITDLPPGAYQLRVTANPERLWPEARYDNDAATTTVVIGPP